jgi:CubicO group peptidase (beta-lactamase class C family)
MPRTHLAALVLLTPVLLALLLVPAAGASCPDGIDRLVRRVMDAERVPGVALAVVEGERLACFRGYGRGDAAGGPPRLETPFLVGSLSKAFTALVVMQLHEEGSLDIEAPVTRYLPWFRTADSEDWRRVTVRHLLHQSSGIDRRTDRSFVPEPPRQRAQAVLRSRLLYEPGSGFSYANANYLLLGLIAEEAGGRPLADLVRERVFRPLGLRHSGTSIEETPGLATGHKIWFGWPVADPAPVRPGLAEGGVVASAGDLARLVIALGHQGRLDGRQALSPSVVEAVQEPGIEIDAERAYAMGWYRRPLAGRPSVSHGGSTPGYSAFVARFPDEDRAVIVLTNVWGAIWGSRAPAWIAADVATHLAGGEPPEERPGDVRKYWILNLAVVLLIVFEVRDWRRLWRFRGRPEAGRRRASRAYGVSRGLAQIVLALGLLVAVPWYVGLPLRAFWAISFDLGWLLFVGAGIGVLKGVAQLFVLEKTDLHVDCRSRRLLPNPEHPHQPVVKVK